MNNESNNSFILENYRYAKSENVSTIATQYKILSILITATAAVFVYILDNESSDTLPLIICSCLIIPGLYAFFGALWLDQVYRQRRLAAYIYRIEEKCLTEQDRDVVIGHMGWEHFVRLTNNSFKRVNTPSRFYYAICLGLFTFFPVATAVFSCIYSGENVLIKTHSLHLPAIFGLVLWGCYIISLICYTVAIRRIEKRINEPDTKPEKTEGENTDE